MLDFCTLFHMVYLFEPHVTSDEHRIEQSSMLHSFKKNERILTKFSRFMACTIGVMHTKNMLPDQVYLFQSLKMSDSSISNVRRSIKKLCGEKSLRSKWHPQIDAINF